MFASITRNFRAALLGAAAILATATGASAVPFAGSVNIGGGAFDDTGSLATRTLYSPSTNAVAGLNTPRGVTGNFNAMGFPELVSFTEFTVAAPSFNPTASTFKILGETFNFTASKVQVVQAIENYADFLFTGTLNTWLAGFEGGTATFRASVNRNQGAVEFGGTLAATGQPVPEPASLALLGAGLIGLGLVKRRRV